jgi:hypothetical protein
MAKLIGGISLALPLPLAGTLLVLRGITDGESATRFLSPALSHLHSPYLDERHESGGRPLDAAIERKEPS